jgi:histidine ammonia-lyase
MLVMSQALDCRGRMQSEQPGPGVRAAHAAVREQSAELTADRSLAEDVEGFDLERVVAAVEAEVGELA